MLGVARVIFFSCDVWCAVLWSWLLIDAGGTAVYAVAHREVARGGGGARFCRVSCVGYGRVMIIEPMLREEGGAACVVCACSLQICILQERAKAL